MKKWATLEENDVKINNILYLFYISDFLIDPSVTLNEFLKETEYNNIQASV